ncbi:hypothetical protein YC2023_017463 [Brassica napus]
MLYTYNSAIHGFSTWLTPQEADSLMTQPCGISVLPEKQYKLHTTRTTLLLGLESLNQKPATLSSEFSTPVFVQREKKFQTKDTVLFRLHGKAKCEAGANFPDSLCNRKLVGARFFTRGYEVKNGPMDDPKSQNLQETTTVMEHTRHQPRWDP